MHGVTHEIDEQYMYGLKYNIRDNKPLHPSKEFRRILLNVSKIAGYNQECCHVECIYSLEQYRIVLIDWCQMEGHHQQNKNPFQIV